MRHNPAGGFMAAACADEEIDPAFEIVRPARRTAPVVFTSPHSGREYPPAFLAASRLDSQTLRTSEDLLVDLLFADAVAHGGPLLKAHFPRAFLDVNREPYELDPAMFIDPLPKHANATSARVAGGLGTIPRIVADQEEIYARPLPFAEAERRIASYYRPFHAALADLMAETLDSWPFALLLDLHSMPSSAALPQPGSHGEKSDIVLGDRFGPSCDGGLTDALEDALVRQGFSVMRNRPYAGGFITAAWGRPAEGFHAIQLEVNRALYADERQLRPLPRFRGVARRLVAAVGDFVAVALPRAHNLAAQ
jgi:N-formylglutamate amidohydrolase